MQHEPDEIMAVIDRAHKVIAPNLSGSLQTLLFA
jgi:hypothetical protein